MAKAQPDKTTPWGLANSLNQAICARVFGPMYRVYYPWRETGDLYVAMDNLIKELNFQKAVGKTEVITELKTFNLLQTKDTSKSRY